MRFVKNDCRPNCWKRHHAKYRLKPDSMVQFNIEWPLNAPKAMPPRTNPMERIMVGTKRAFMPDTNPCDPNPRFRQPSRCTTNVRTRIPRRMNPNSGNINCRRQMSRMMPVKIVRQGGEKENTNKQERRRVELRSDKAVLDESDC